MIFSIAHAWADEAQLLTYWFIDGEVGEAGLVVPGAHPLKRGDGPCPVRDTFRIQAGGQG